MVSLNKFILRPTNQFKAQPAPFALVKSISSIQTSKENKKQPVCQKIKNNRCARLWLRTAFRKKNCGLWGCSSFSRTQSIQGSLTVWKKTGNRNQNALNRIFSGVCGRPLRYTQVTRAQEVVCYFGSCDYQLVIRKVVQMTDAVSLSVSEDVSVD